MLNRKTTITIASKLIMLFVSFGLMVLSTQIWGDEGRGEIAIVFANVAIINIIINMAVGSTVAFHASKVQRNELLGIAFFGALGLSMFGTVLFSFIIGFQYFLHLFAISLLQSGINAISQYWLGREDIGRYNILTLVSSVAVIAVMLFLLFVLAYRDLNVYFYSFYLAYGMVLVASIFDLVKSDPFTFHRISLSTLKRIINYGYRNELNYFIQFLNYRLSYFFIEEWLGLGTLGVFSISVGIAEAIWVVSKSLSVIHFSRVVNSNNKADNIKQTRSSAKQSFWVSLAVIVAMVLTPSSLFEFVFGADFAEVKQYTMYLIPGIIAISVSNLWGHYFAGIGKLKILRDKALFGLLATVVLSIVLIPSYQLLGACIAINVSYLLSAAYLWWMFKHERNE